MKAALGTPVHPARKTALNNGFWRPDVRPSTLAFGVFCGAMTVTPPVFAQADASEHASHHPAGAAPAVTPSTVEGASQTMTARQPPEPRLPEPAPGAPSSPSPTQAQAGMPPDGKPAMGKMMEGMMGGTGQGCCGGAGTELYPFMMSLSSMTPEQRVQVQRLSAARIGEGKALVQLGQQRLFEAIASGDHKVAAEAMQQLRDGLGRIGSGAAAHKVLAEGTRPQATAMRWFKGEMNLGPVGDPESGMESGRLSVMHMIVMALLIGFAIAMITMYFFKMRRTASLFGRIEAGSENHLRERPRRWVVLPHPTVPTGRIPGIYRSSPATRPRRWAPSVHRLQRPALHQKTNHRRFQTLNGTAFFVSSKLSLKRQR